MTVVGDSHECMQGSHSLRNSNMNMEDTRQSMEEIMTKAFGKTLERCKTTISAGMHITRWNESVFRFFFCQSLCETDSNIVQHVECNKIDLVLHAGSDVAFIEFKFYIHSPVFDPCSGKRKHSRKSFPSEKNYKNFSDCVSQLKKRRCDRQPSKFLVLFYADPVEENRMTYESLYEKRRSSDQTLGLKEVCKEEPFCIKQFDGSVIKCCAWVFAV